MKSWLIIVLSIVTSGCMTVTENTELKVESDGQEKAESRITLGLGYLENGNMVKAHENLEKALEHAPDYYRSMLAIAHYYEKVGETEKAYKAYDDALSEHSDNGHVLNNFGAFLCKIGKYEKAEDYFVQATKAEQYYLIAASYENAGLCAIKYQNLYKAKQYFIRAIDHDPKRTRSLLQLARLEIESGEFAQARVRLVKFQNEFGYQKSSLKLLAELEKRTGNTTLEKKYRALLAQH